MNRIKELRTERGYSYRGMENKIGINYAVINYYENEKRDPSTATIKMLAEFFEVTIDYLLCYSGCYVYASYEKEPMTIKIRDDYYNELKNSDCIYFKDDKRYVNLNKIIGVSNDSNILGLYEEFTRINKLDELFNKKTVLESDIEETKDIKEIELTRSLIKKIKDAIS